MGVSYTFTLFLFIISLFFECMMNALTFKCVRAANEKEKNKISSHTMHTFTKHNIIYALLD
jgi:hypothetical protein